MTMKLNHEPHDRARREWLDGPAARADWQPIASIIADGYDAGEDTDSIARAVSEWILNGTPNPFEELLEDGEYDE